MNQENFLKVKEYLLQLQNTICHELSLSDGKETFKEDQWEHKNGTGGGRTRVMRNGNVFESAGVNFSHVTGASLPAPATQKRPELTGAAFEATGLSLVLHPHNPFVPTTHANIRLFMAHKPTGETVWWFGGGYDLTPYYGFEEDAIHWHQTAKAACEPFGETVYSDYKKWCDDYFYLPHRNEARGIGGLFFDDLNHWDFETCFAFLRAVGDSFLEAYLPIVERRRHHAFNEQHREFQLYRRGRYVEFNLLYDRGTLFGIHSGGRTESILMSLPARVSWEYNWKPTEGSAEAQLYEKFLPARDWV